MEGQKMWQVKEVRANVRQAKRYAERWCAARLYPELPLREAVARLTNSTPIQPEPPLPACRRRSSNRPGAWPRLGRRRSADRGGARTAQAAGRDGNPERGTPARRG